MPVRDSTAWRHAILQKKVINLDHAGNRKVCCAWDTCEKDGFESHKIRVRTHEVGYEERYMHYVFCSERHKAYWLEAVTPGRSGHLPKGMRLSIL